MAAVGAWVGRELLDPATHLFTTARYNACPTIRYMPDGFFCKPHATPLPEPHVCTQHFAATFCTRIVCTSMMMVPHAGPLPRRPAHTLLLRPPRRHLRHSHRPLERPRRLGSGPGQASNRTGARECPELAGALDDAGFDAGEVWRGVCEMAGAAVLANRERHKIARIIGPSYETNEAAPCTARPLGRLL